jgi:hypothetical protein
MSGFAGKWKLESSDNFDEYMKALGVGFMTRKVAATAKPTVIISQSGAQWTLRSESSIKAVEFTFGFDEEFDEGTADGRKVKSVVHKDSDTKWTHTQKGDVPSTITRELTDPNTLVMMCEAAGVTSKRVYKRSE